MKTIVENALKEDIGTGDITSELISADEIIKTKIISRERGILCGIEWVNEVFHQLDKNIHINWEAADGDQISPDQTLCVLSGPARAMLTGERTALNFLQLLSGTSTLTNKYVEKIKHTSTKLLDTRKTIPGLRDAQKYAVKCGGGENHRMGLHDAFLIKENHIHAQGSITEAIAKARKNHSDKKLEIEVENLKQLKEAISGLPDVIMLDNFDLQNIKEAVTIVEATQTQIKLEASGGVSLENIKDIAETGIDFISVGSLTKDIKALDISMVPLTAEKERR